MGWGYKVHGGIIHGLNIDIATAVSQQGGEREGKGVYPWDFTVFSEVFK